MILAPLYDVAIRCKVSIFNSKWLLDRLLVGDRTSVS